MIGGFPQSFADLASWSKDNGVTIDEARRRFVQYATLCGIASVASLRESIVFKGGNALDFIWQPNRSTIDLDFSFDMNHMRFKDSVESIHRLLERSLAVSTSRFGIVFAITSVTQQPPGENRTFITYKIRIAYALPDETRLMIRMANNQNSPHMLPIEISLNEPIGESTRVSLDESFPDIRVCTLDDIVGEKLRAILQQPIRNRNRRQDVLDIAVIVEGDSTLDLRKVADYLMIKAAARNIVVSKSAFQHPDIRERAKLDYAALEPSTRTRFIPFDEAFAAVLRLVHELPIPADHKDGRSGDSA